MAELDKRHLLKSAYNYTQAGQWDRALEEYRKLIRGYPEDPNIHSMVADLLAKRGDHAGAAREQVEAARLYKASGADDKELGALRKALRVQAGDTAATQALQEHVARSLALAQAALASGKLDAAEAIGNRLLDAEPSSLAASALLDTVRAARLAEQSRLAMEEEAGTAERQAAVPDAAAEVLVRLEGAVEGYLAVEDYDNAIETLMVMLKLDPGRVGLQVQLAQAQAQLIGKQQAQAKWSALQSAQRQQPIAEAREIVEEVDLAAWRDEEEAVRRRLEEEQRLAEDQARRELEIVDAAVKELQANRGAAPVSPAGPAETAPDDDDEARLKALLEERAALQRRLAEEQAAAARHGQEEVEARLRGELMQAHALEMARQEAEAKAKAEALRELEARLESEREAQRREFEAERARLQAQEQALRDQLKELMREEMQRMQAEVREQALNEIRDRIQAEEGRRQALESAADRRARDAEAAASAQRGAVEAERRRAEEAAAAQRVAVQALKRQEDERKQAMLDEAARRRAARQGAGEGRSAVLKNSRRISDVLHAATTRHLGSDIDAQLEAARRYLKQDLLLDAMRLAQKMAEQEPDNVKVKELLKLILQRKGL